MIEAFVIVWNEIDIIQLTIDHYKQFCDKITFFDNHSDDGTQEVILKNGCELKTFGQKGVLNDKDYINIKNSCWKQSIADWVIVVDCDEIVHHSAIKRVLQESTGTIFKTIGFNIYSNDMPQNSYLEITNGVYSENYSKLCVFSPKIKDINYVYGAHVARPTGDIRYCKDKLLVLHYRNIGGVRRIIDRHAQYRNRMSDFNKKWQLGIHYLQDDETRKRDWEDFYTISNQINIDGVV